MNPCFLCGCLMVPDVPAACKNALLRQAYEAIQYASNRHQPVWVADYSIRLIPDYSICLIEELYDPENPKVSLTNSIETVMMQLCHKYSLCPAR